MLGLIVLLLFLLQLSFASITHRWWVLAFVLLYVNCLFFFFFNCKLLVFEFYITLCYGLLKVKLLIRKNVSKLIRWRLIHALPNANSLTTK